MAAEPGLEDYKTVTIIHDIERDRAAVTRSLDLVLQNMMRLDKVEYVTYMSGEYVQL